LLKLRGWDGAYLKINELTALFTRELFLGSPTETWVMFIRNLPQVKTTRLNFQDHEAVKKCLTTAGVAFPDYELPMIQAIRRLDLDQGLLEAGRVFSQEHDILGGQLSSGGGSGMPKQWILPGRPLCRFGNWWSNHLPNNNKWEMSQDDES
jgi:hypothetical protein